VELSIEQQRAIALASARARAAAPPAQPTQKPAPAQLAKIEAARRSVARNGAGPDLGAPIAQAATFNLMDEITGGLDALQTGAENLGRRVTGKPVPYSMGDMYQASRDVYRANEEAGRKQLPLGKVLLEEAIGATMTPGAKGAGDFIVRGGSTLAKVRRAATVGAGYGAAYGAGGAKEGERGVGAAKGGMTGGVVGGALPVVGAGAGKALSPVAALLGDSVLPSVRAILQPTFMDAAAIAGKKAGAGAAPGEKAAAKVLAKALDRDASQGAKLAPGRAPMYAGGENLKALIEVAAKSPGPARQMIKTAVAERRAAVPQEVESDLAQTLGAKGDYFAALDRATKDRATNAREGMKALAGQLVTLDADSISALRSDLAKGALREAAANGLASTDPELRAASANLNRLAEMALDKPSAQTMTVREAQDISESLLSAADAAYKGGNGARGKALKQLGQAIRLNARTPERGGFADYDAWLKQYGTDSDNRRALELGREAFKATPPEKVQTELEQMGQSALDFYRKGVGEALLDKVRGAGGDIRVMRDLLRDRNFARRVEMAFPEDGSFADFLKAADRRVQEADMNSRLTGGSPTYPLAAAKQDLEGEASPAMDIVGDVVTGNLSGAARKAAASAMKALPKRSAGVLADPAANAALGRAAINPDELTRLLNLLQAQRAATALQTRLGAKAVTPAVAITSSRGQ